MARESHDGTGEHRVRGNGWQLKEREGRRSFDVTIKRVGLIVGTLSGIAAGVAALLVLLGVQVVGPGKKIAEVNTRMNTLSQRVDTVEKKFDVLNLVICTSPQIDDRPRVVKQACNRVLRDAGMEPIP